MTCGLLRRIRKAGDTSGAAAVEFGIILPVILALYLGTAEVAQGVAVDRKVTITARALSDLVAQDVSINDTEMANIFSAATAIMTPYSISPLKAKVSAVSIDANGNATVRWSSAYNDVPRAADTPVTIPPALRVANSQVIWSEISYVYTPPVAKYISGTLTLSEQFFARPRESVTICRPPAVTTCS